MEVLNPVGDPYWSIYGARIPSEGPFSKINRLNFRNNGNEIAIWAADFIGSGQTVFKFNIFRRLWSEQKNLDQILYDIKLILRFKK